MKVLQPSLTLPREVHHHLFHSSIMLYADSGVGTTGVFMHVWTCLRRTSMSLVDNVVKSNAVIEGIKGQVLIVVTLFVTAYY